MTTTRHPTRHPIWIMLDPRYSLDRLGHIPKFLELDDPRPARAQFDDRYSHGGGWNPMKEWRFDRGSLRLSYPGDPPLRPIACTTLRREEIFFYPHAWVVIVQLDGSWEVSRMD